MKTKIAFALLLCLLAIDATAQDRPKALYKVSRLSLTDVGISCTNGGAPAASKYGDTLIITCGR